MTRYYSIDKLFEVIHQAYIKTGENIFVIMVGGCSRAGKTTLSTELVKRFGNSNINSRLVNIDSWLISVDKRKPDSIVSERYDLPEINAAVEKLLTGREISPPIYDAASRKRVEGITGDPVQLDSGVLIVEGVITLADKGLLSKSDLSIFVDIKDTLRIKRLLDFYNKVKKVERAVYKRIILDREKEETLFVKQTAENADLIFNW